MLSASAQKILLYFVCLVALYVSWGSAYLLVKLGLDYYPPVLLIGIRMIIAGACLILYTYARKENSKINFYEIKRAVILGFHLVVVGTSFISIAQESIPSGTAAMIYGITPIMLLVGTWLFANAPRPSNLQFLGLFLGLSMVVWIKIHQGSQGEASPFGLGMAFLATIGWVYGSYLSYKPEYKTDLSIFRSTGLILFIGGVLSTVFGIAIGEELNAAAFSFEGIVLLINIAFLSSIVGFTSYLWLLANARPSVAISYEYVTPVIAIYLGYQFGGETLDSTVIFACVGLVLSILLVISRGRG